MKFFIFKSKFFHQIFYHFPSTILGKHTKSITIFEDDGSSEMGDAEAIIELTYNIFQYLPELTFVSIYALCMYAAILWITKTIKGK